MSKLPPKPFKSYSELVELLKSRGMIVEDSARAERKLAQIGYYRLSGFWYPCRKFTANKTRADEFEINTSFNAILELYLFDKKLRQLMLDAIERIEIHIRSVIAHELGELNPLAYKQEKFINPKNLKTFEQKRDGATKTRNDWKEWSDAHERTVERSQEECITWHKSNHKEIPFWVVVEAWDFGTLSKYFKMLNGTHQNKICKRLNISNPKNLENWLREINTLRNRCAHHARIWNRSHNPLKITGEQDVNLVNLGESARTRIYGLIVIIWFLIKKIGPSSDWLNNVADLIDEKPNLPGCSYSAMGFPDEYGFPRKLFGLPNKNIVINLGFSEKRHIYSLVTQYINRNNLTKKRLFSVLALILSKFSKLR